jgi:hypothetical protein
MIDDLFDKIKKVNFSLNDINLNNLENNNNNQINKLLNNFIHYKY